MFKVYPSAGTRASQRRRLYFHELSARSRRQTITGVQRDMNVKSRHSETVANLKKKSYLILCSKLSLQPSHVFY
jgi:hypothetical protein